MDGMELIVPSATLDARSWNHAHFKFLYNIDLIKYNSLILPSPFYLRAQPPSWNDAAAEELAQQTPTNQLCSVFNDYQLLIWILRSQNHVLFIGPSQLHDCLEVHYLPDDHNQHINK